MQHAGFGVSFDVPVIPQARACCPGVDSVEARRCCGYPRPLLDSSFHGTLRLQLILSAYLGSHQQETHSTLKVKYSDLILTTVVST